MSHRLWLIVTVLASALPAGAEEEVPVLEVHGEAVRPIAIAVPRPAGADGEVADRFWRRLRRAVAFHGALAPTDPEADLGGGDFGRPDLRAWRATGAELLLQTRLADDRRRVEALLYDLTTRERLVGRRFTLRQGRYEQLADAVAGAVVEELLGVRSPFGGRIAFQYRKPGSRWRELALTDWTGERFEFVTQGQRLVLDPAFVPVRGSIAAVGYRRLRPTLYLFDLQRGVEVPVLRGRTGMHGPGPTPDGEHVVVAWERNGNTDLYLVALSTGKWRRLTTSTAADLSPTVSPDGRKVAFVSDRRGNPYLFLLDLESGRVEPLLVAGVYLAAPAWSPDGRWIVFLRRDRGTAFGIWVLEVATGRQLQVTPNAEENIESPTWAPDSRTILFSRLRDGSYDLWKVDRALRRPVRITRFPGDARMPAWEGGN